jgi:hypothetical protein
MYNAKGNDCPRIVTIDSIEFYNNYQAYSGFDTITTFKKENGFIKVHIQDSMFCFEDDLSDEYFFEYNIIGQKDDWILILGQDYHTDQYYLINQATSKIDTLVGFPQIYENKLLCLEGDQTDGTKYIEVWEVNNNVAILISKVDLKKYELFGINEIYLKNKTVYMRNGYNSHYFKIIWNGTKGDC